MATVVFYQKPGCATNARQIRALEAAGHSVTVRDLLKGPWTAEALRGFFGETPVGAWFNRAAPRVKSGEINPDASDAETALALMLADPLLIRRPLIEANGTRCAGSIASPCSRCWDRAPLKGWRAVRAREPQGGVSRQREPNFA